MTTFSFEAIGTTWRIDIDENLSKKGEQSLLEKIKVRIEKFDKDYSRFRSDSLVTRISQRSVRNEKFCVSIAPDDAEPLFSLYQRLYDLTNGLFTPLIGQVLADAGYDATYSFNVRAKDFIAEPLNKPKELYEVFSFKNPILEMKEPALLDFGAAGKGYLIDIIGEILESEEVNSYCVDAGGDIRYRNQNRKLLRVGLENPENTRQVIGVVPIVNQSVCGSAGNRRKWRNFHHIFNPHLLTPVNNILATWVIAETTLLADALSTCLFLVSGDILYKEYKFEYFVLYPDFSIEKSGGFDVKLFSE